MSQPSRLRRAVPGGALAAAILLNAAVGIGACAAAEPEPFDIATIDGFKKSRVRMVETILGEMHLTRLWLGKSTIDPRILAVMERLPRHEFVPPALASLAYLNRPLPVGFGQTVSQPYMVALMTDLAAVEPGDAVLLLGIGGGYHAALLAELAGEVHVVDMQAPVAAAAMNRLVRLGYDKVRLSNHDPYFGWRENGRSFDVIIARQAVDHIPDALIRQLKPGGRLVAPIGGSDLRQDLVLARKTADGRLVERTVMPVRFTRLPGGPRI